MYLEHFGLREMPFGMTPDASFCFAGAGHNEALNVLLAAVRSGEGFIRIIGEAGAGKTLLCRKFLAALSEGKFSVPAAGCNPAKFFAIYLAESDLEPRSLLLTLAEAFCIPVEQGIEQRQLAEAVTTKLAAYAREGKCVLVCLDDAHAMPPESLELLRLLAGIGASACKLMQVAVFAQPEAGFQPKQNSCVPDGSIGFQYELKALRSEELNRYLRHRLGVAGYSGVPIFTKRSVAMLQRASGGVPRLVNAIANEAMLLAFGDGRHQVLPRHVRGAAGDMLEAKRDWRMRISGIVRSMLSLLGARWVQQR